MCVPGVPGRTSAWAERRGEGMAKGVQERRLGGFSSVDVGQGTFLDRAVSTQ